MGQALYRKYRSKSLGEIVGQEHITRTLEQALKSGRISHAYLFTGPRGVGKTSIARILAHEINQLPYVGDEQHIDIIEIDAASNRRIDEIRDLRDKVYIAPAQAKYKIYIIDEVHMLTREAFNALLKTLEEPPAHAVFILATTEAHKLPATIISRTQRFVFRPIAPADALVHLKTIAKKEKIDITDEALSLIIQHSEGSFRDAISLLDQAAGRASQIDPTTIQDMLGMPPAEASEQLLALLKEGSVNQLVSQLSGLYDQGFRATAIAKQLAGTIRAQIVSGKTTLEVSKLAALLSELLEVPISHDPERYLEVVLLSHLSSNSVAKPLQTSPLPKSPAAVTPPKNVSQAKPEAPKKIKADTKASTTSSGVHLPVTSLGTDSWQQVLTTLKNQHNTLYGIVRMARPDFSEPGQLHLTFAFAFHQKRMNEAKNQQLVEEAISAVTGGSVQIICELDPKLKLAQGPLSKPTDNPVTSTAKASASEPLSTISNIFGGGELLQS